MQGQPVISTPHSLKMPSRWHPFVPLYHTPILQPSVLLHLQHKNTSPSFAVIAHLLHLNVASGRLGGVLYVLTILELNTRRFNIWNQLSHITCVICYFFCILLYILLFLTHEEYEIQTPQRAASSSVHITDCTIILQIVTMDN